MNRFRQNSKEQLKEQCLNYLGGKICKRCNNRDMPICCYEFHHHKGCKEMEISKLISQKKPFDIVKKELDKCVVVCANCHRLIHYFKINMGVGQW